MHAGHVMEQVVADLVAAIEAGAGEWTMPWRQMGATGWPANAVTHNRYSGGNALVLSLAAARQGYPSAQWATYKGYGQDKPERRSRPGDGALRGGVGAEGPHMAGTGQRAPVCSASPAIL